VIDKEKSKGRGRPRAFDRDQALDQAQALFHAQGYEGIGVAALAQAMGVNPPSLYAAFGSKAQLFEEVLDRYARSALPVDTLLAEGAEPVAALTALLRVAAAIYTADPQAPGCLVLEGARGADPDAALRARVWREASAARIAAFVAHSDADKAGVVGDYMVSIMSGLSADARAGHDVARLTAVADMAALALQEMLTKAG
jgi:TetR/AcrR family transcriptional repressor for divergent bdcA